MFPAVLAPSAVWSHPNSNGDVYEMFMTPLTHADARAVCQARGGDLASVHDTLTFDYITLAFQRCVSGVNLPRATTCVRGWVVLLQFRGRGSQEIIWSAKGVSVDNEHIQPVWVTPHFHNAHCIRSGRINGPS
jgi:hypothetical protein